MDDRERLISNRLQEMSAFTDGLGIRTQSSSETCSQCGANLVDATATFCTACGANLSASGSLITRRWKLLSFLVLVSVAVVSGMVWFVVAMMNGIAEVRDIGPWPSEQVSAMQLLDIDMTDEGLDTFVLDEDPINLLPVGHVDRAYLGLPPSSDSIGLFEPLGQAIIARYPDGEDAQSAFDVLASGAPFSPVCRTQFTSSFGSQSVFRCTMEIGHQRVYRSDVWLLAIFAPESEEVPAGERVISIRDVITNHWKTFDFK